MPACRALDLLHAVALALRCSDLAPVIPVVVLDDAADAVPLARALVAGGLPAIEVTLRTPAALDAIRAIADEVPEAVVGAGTVLTPGQVEAPWRPGPASWSARAGRTAAGRDAGVRGAVPAGRLDDFGGRGAAGARGDAR